MQPAETKHQHYADALVALAQGAGVQQRVSSDLAQVLRLLDEQPELRRFLASPRIAEKGKYAALDELLSGKLHAVLLHFLLLLQEVQVMDALPQIAESFFSRMARLQERMAGELHSAAPLSADRVAAIEREVSRLLGRQVELRVSEDADIVGGLLVKVGDFVIDGTVDRQLRDAREALLKA